MMRDEYQSGLRLLMWLSPARGPHQHEIRDVGCPASYC
jgi:hypothetical protein